MPGMLRRAPRRVSTGAYGKAIQTQAASWPDRLQMEIGMVRTFKSLALVGALMMVASPVFAAEVMKTQVGDFDLDPFNILAPAEPAAAPAAAPAPMMKKKHHHKHKMMMK